VGVVIRMARIGTKSKPRYRIVVADSKFPKEGRNLAILGSYNPFAKENGVTVSSEKVSAWIKKGAQMSNRVAKVLKNAKIQL